MSAPTPTQPDILWIITTQWRAQALSCNGDTNARTPALEALAARSINYVEAVTPHPFGPFARAALLTGIASPANGVCDYYDPLPRGTRTIAHELNEVGYDTAYIGKWHLSARDPKAPLVGETHARQFVSPEDRGGFSYWEGFEGGFLLNDPWLQGNDLPEPRQFPGYQSEVLCDRLLHWLGIRSQTTNTQPLAPLIQTEQTPQAAAELPVQAPGFSKQTGTKPWFAVLSLETPHPPYAAPAGDCQPPKPDSLKLRANVPLGGETEAQARRELAGYYAHIEATDRALGRLLSQPGLRDTLIVFSSVHGDMHGSHGLFRKGWPHEECLRIPLIVRLPRGLRRFQLAVSSADLVSLLDLHAWTRRWAGIQNGTTPHPQRLLQACSMPSIVRLPHQCDRTWTVLRTREGKLVLNADGSPWLYFDLITDPLEQHNLAGDPAQAERIAAFKAAATEVAQK